MNFENNFNSLINQNALKCNDLDVEVKDLYNKVGTASSTLSTLGTTVSGISTTLTNLGTTVSGLNSTVGGISTNVSNLSSTVTSHGTSIGTINGNISSINSSISSINSSITSINNSVEKVTLIYDKDSQSASVNMGYTAGINSSTSVSIDLSTYKYIKIYFTMFNHNLNDYGATNAMQIMSLHNALEGYAITTGKCILFTGGYVQGAEFSYILSYNTIGHYFTPYFYFDRNLQTSGYYFVSKIEGVK